MFQAGGNTLHSEVHKLTNSMWNKEGLTEQWMDSIIVRVCKGDKTDSNIYQRILVLLTTYKISSNILLSRLTVCVNKIIGDHQCRFCCN